jgi:hypothetical protein
MGYLSIKIPDLHTNSSIIPHMEINNVMASFNQFIVLRSSLQYFGGTIIESKRTLREIWSTKSPEEKLELLKKYKAWKTERGSNSYISWKEKHITIENFHKNRAS